VAYSHGETIVELIIVPIPNLITFIYQSNYSHK